MMKYIWFLALAWLLVLGLACGNKAGQGDTNANQGGPGAALVAGGNVMTSASYRVVLTTGQSPGGNGVMTSQSYRFQGGLVGSTQ